MYNKRAMPRIMARAAVKQCKFEIGGGGDGHFSPPLALSSQQSPPSLTNNNYSTNMKNDGTNGGGTFSEAPTIYDDLDKEIGAKVFVHRALGKVLFIRQTDQRRGIEAAEGQRAADDETRDGPAWQHHNLQQQFLFDSQNGANGTKGGGGITLMAPAPPPPMAFAILPGIANDVECFPCRVCCSPDQPQRVFLTRAGLEKHAAAQHPERMGELVDMAQHIQNVWANRRWHQNRAGTASGTCYEPMANGGIGIDPLPASNEATVAQVVPPKLDGTAAQIVQQQCSHCNAPSSLFDTRCHGQMNDRFLARHDERMGAELRNIYGTVGFVQPAVDCQNHHQHQHGAVDEHEQNDNVRHGTRPRRRRHCVRRRYMCHWCTRMFDGIAQLNAHKQRAHRGIGMTTAKKKATTAEDFDDEYGDNDGEQFDHDDNDIYGGDDNGTTAPTTTAMAAVADNDAIVRPVPKPFALSSSVGVDAHAKVQCHLCGLVMVRPSLFIRHMARVHQRRANFDANVVYPRWPFVPPLRYAVDGNGQLSWRCCEHKFTDKASLLYHRATVHYNRTAPSMATILGQQRQ